MILDVGKERILRYLSGAVPNYAEFMVFGIGDAAEVATQRALSFEYFRSRVDLIDFDSANDLIVARAFIPDDLRFQIHEVGLLVEDSRIDSESVGRIITNFDTLLDPGWSGYTTTSSGIRVGTNAFTLAASPSQVNTMASTSTPGNFLNMMEDDRFVLAYNSVTNVPAFIRVRFHRDASNYREYEFVPSAGFNSHRWEKDDFVETGNAPWNEFRYMEVEIEAGGSATEVIFEAMRLCTSCRGDLVTRQVLPSPVQKFGVAELQFEYKLELSFT